MVLWDPNSKLEHRKMSVVCRTMPDNAQGEAGGPGGTVSLGQAKTSRRHGSVEELQISRSAPAFAAVGHAMTIRTVKAMTALVSMLMGCAGSSFEQVRPPNGRVVMAHVFAWLRDISVMVWHAMPVTCYSKW